MTTKKKSLNQKKESNPFDNALSSITQLAGTGFLSSILTKGFKLDTPFIDYRDTVVVIIGKYMNKYFEICSDNTLWKYKDYDKRVSEYDKLITIIKSVNILLKSLIPEKATNKKGVSIIRVFNDHPDILVTFVNEYKEKIDEYVKRPYKRDKEIIKPDIIRVCEEVFKIKNVNALLKKFDNRSNNKIAVGILAYQLCVSQSYLDEIYNAAKKNLKK